MNKVYITSDHHFGHKNIIQHEKRPFDSVDDMDVFMIETWNSIVNKNDTVWHLGDFSFQSKSTTKHIFNQLNGTINLIMGNHDKAHSVSWWKEIGFNKVYDYAILKNHFTILSHEPANVGYSDFYNIHGHVHSKTIEIDNYFNASVEANDYKPVLLQPILNNFMYLKEGSPTKKEEKQ